MPDRKMTFEEFVASARQTHFDQLTDDERSHAPNYEGCDVVVFAGGPSLCKEGDVFWYEDYQRRYQGTWDEMVRSFYDFLDGEDGLWIFDS